MKKRRYYEEKETNKFVISKLKDVYYGIGIDVVVTIERVPEITRVPNTDDHVVGVMNLRGDIIPVIDLRERFGLPTIDVTKDTRIVLVNTEKHFVGLLVDSSSEVMDLEVEKVETVATLPTPLDNDYIAGIGKDGERMIVILNVENILAPLDKKLAG